MRLTLSHCCCRQRLALDRAAAPREDHRPGDDATPVAVTAPNGSAPVAEVFAWMNRQITWESLLADLEVVRWLAEGESPRS